MFALRTVLHPRLKFSTLIAFVMLTLVSALAVPPAHAAGSYDGKVTFTLPAVDATHGPVTGVRLYRNCQTGETLTLVGAVISGQTFAGLITTNGTFNFCAKAYNSTGEGPRSVIKVIELNDFDPVPGQVTDFEVTLTCDATCTVTITTVP